MRRDAFAKIAFATCRLDLAKYYVGLSEYELWYRNHLIAGSLYKSYRVKGKSHHSEIETCEDLSAQLFGIVVAAVHYLRPRPPSLRRC